MSARMPIEWTLKDVLDRHNISAYRVAKEADVGLTTIYRFTNNQVQTFNGQIVDSILQAVYDLTVTQYDICDIVKWAPKGSSHE